MLFGTFIAAIVPKIKAVVAVSLGVTFSLFLLNMLNTIINDKILEYIIPFRYFNTSYMIHNSNYEMKFVYLSICVFVGLISLTYIIFNKRDIDAN